MPTAAVTPGQITLFVDGYFANPFDATCFVALEEKRVPYTTSRALLRDNQGFPKQFQSRIGIPRIPAIQHGDFWLTESLAIAEYLDDTFPNGTRLFPTEIRARARARQLMAWVRIDLRALRDERPWFMALYPATPKQPLTDAARRDGKELLELVDWLADNGSLAEWNIAHVDLAFSLMRMTADFELSTAATRLLDANLVRPSVRAYLDHPRPPHPPP